MILYDLATECRSQLTQMGLPRWALHKDLALRLIQHLLKRRNVQVDPFSGLFVIHVVGDPKHLSQ